MSDPVNHPPHYTAHPSGIECIQITEHMGFNLGNAIKYIWRADLKGNTVEDLAKAKWYLEREIAKRTPPAEGSNERPRASKRMLLCGWRGMAGGLGCVEPLGHPGAHKFSDGSGGLTNQQQD